jgi:hypothetical protein
MPIQARSSPYVIVVTVPIRLLAQDVAKPAWTKSRSRFQSLSVWFTVPFLRVAMQRLASLLPNLFCNRVSTG